ncbi:predicted protein [Naegleria gruberi]|uniref:Predicted protein n=1 Tax=Naegleria gruberi TaxID=5762 RepID=D2VXX5_NAEGR|nr:uncharacterized protein NAEGRDRAFT_73911 [Naegleria gruberi]EFC38368.1 predicted protein [Naegleria gruberi]|eukprot:XP_002671112.1 predicted protein [Naegleria gruberi strain NEG-M]
MSYSLFVPLSLSLSDDAPDDEIPPCKVCKGMKRLKIKKQLLEAKSRMGEITQVSIPSDWNKIVGLGDEQEGSSYDNVEHLNQVLLTQEELQPKEGEQLCGLVGGWRIFQKKGGHRWTTDDIVTAWAACTAVKTILPLIRKFNRENQPSSSSSSSTDISIEEEDADIKWEDLISNYLDIGCGNGSVLMMVARNMPLTTKCIGVEARSEAVSLARRSIAFNCGLDSTRIQVRNRDFREINSNTMMNVLPEGSGFFDLVTGTPPYFRVNFKHNSNKVEEALIRQGGMPSNKDSCPARCEFRGGIEAYCQAASVAMKPMSGVFVMIDFEMCQHLRRKIMFARCNNYCRSIVVSRRNSEFPSPFGYYGGFVFRVLNYFITFGVDTLSAPYYFTIALSSVIILLYSCFPLLVVYTHKKLYGSAKKRLNSFVGIFSFLVLVFAPFSIFVMTSFIDCDLKTTISVDGFDVYPLIRFPTYACYDSSNVILIVINYIGMAILLGSSLMAVHILPMGNPESSIPFLSENQFTLMGIIGNTIFRIGIVFAIPYYLLYLRAIVHAVFSIVSIVYLFFGVPFFKRYENSVYSAVLFGSFGSSIGVLISCLVNTSNDNNLGAGMLGLVFGLTIIFMSIGYIVMEIYTRLMVHKIRKIFHQFLNQTTDSMSEDDGLTSIMERYCAEIFSTISNTSLTAFRMYMQFNIKKKVGYAVNERTDSNIILVFIKTYAPKKNFDSPILLLYSSLFISHQWTDPNRYSFALYLLKRTEKNHNNNYFVKLSVLCRCRDMEMHIDKSHNGRGNLEVKALLDKLEQKQEELKNVHRAFWKEMTAERPKEEKIYTINAISAEIMTYCDESYEHLLANFPHDKTVIRYYANYVENIKLDKELSTGLFEEAQVLEEEESKNSRTSTYLFNTSRKGSKFKTNRVAPANSHSFSDNLRTSENSLTSFTQRRPSSPTNHTITPELSVIDKQILEDSDDFRGVEEELTPQQLHYRRAAVFRNALNTPYESSIRKSIFIGLAVLSVLLLAAIFSVSVYYDIEVTKTYLVKSSCLTMSSPGAMLRDIRLMQILTETYGNLKWKIPENGTVEYQELQTYMSYYTKAFTFQQQNLLNLQAVSQSGSFSERMYQDYTVEDKTIMVPISNDTSSNTLLEYTNTFKKTTSVREITQELLTHANSVLELQIDYNKSLNSYPFMYIFQNRKYAADAFYTFCKAFQESEKIHIQESRDILGQILLGCSVGFSTIILISISISRLEMEKSSIIFKLYKTISKDIIGVIFQELDKKHKNDELKGLKKKRLPKPKHTTVIVSFIIIAIFLVCSGIFYQEMLTNVERANIAMQNVDIASLMIRTTNRITLRLNEMFSYLSIPLGKSVNNPAIVTASVIAQYRADVRTFTTTVQSLFSQLVYGTNSTNSIIGIYPKIDEMLKGDPTCDNVTLLYCGSLEQMVSIYTILGGGMSENFFNPIYAKNSKEVLNYLVKMYNMNDMVFEKLVDFMDLLVTYTGQASLSSTIGLFIAGLIVLLISNYTMYLSIITYDRQVSSLRGMLNYLPYEWIESNETVKNFVFYNSLPLVNQRNNLKKGSDTLNNLLHSMVDGAVLSNEKGEILLFNTACQRLFSKIPSEVMGLKFYSLFDKANESKLIDIARNCRDYLVEGENNKNGEVMELNCIRKNLSTFPAQVNIFVTRDGDNKVVIVCFIKDITTEKKANTLLSEEKKNSEKLLRNILPESVALKLKSGNSFVAERFNDVSVFFSDMVGFTALSSDMNPSDLILLLNNVVNGFDDLTDKYELEKIKTIGDAYFCVGGLPINPQSDHPERTLRFAMDCFSVIRGFNQATNGEKVINIRIGINTGSVVAGVIGKKKFAYDLWGDTINTASRMESNSKPGRIQISRSTYERVYDLGFEFEERSIDVKGKGVCTCYLMNERYHDNPLDIQVVGNNTVVPPVASENPIMTALSDDQTSLTQ